MNFQYIFKLRGYRKTNIVKIQFRQKIAEDKSDLCSTVSPLSLSMAHVKQPSVKPSVAPTAPAPNIALGPISVRYKAPTPNPIAA